MNEIISILAPELMLAGVACLLFLLGCVNRAAVRRVAPFLALGALLAGVAVEYSHLTDLAADPTGSIQVDALAHYIRILTGVVAVLLLLLAWPAGPEQTGNSALQFGLDAGEFFALFLLSITGLLLVSVANDLMVLFLALELVSIPTYIMVSISRPLAVAQEAGVKYFFLGALSVALMLFGFSFLFGTAGSTNFAVISETLRRNLTDGSTPLLDSWQKLGVLLVLLGFAFKMAAFPLQFYAGDVYEGAATPVTAFLAFVPKTAGFVALIRLLFMIGGPTFALPRELVLLLGVVAAITMSLGNVLGLLQSNVKRVLAYSSIAHTGYMLVGITALASVHADALQGVLFYLAAYGIMNTAAFGVLMLLPARDGHNAAETFDDLAGQGRQHVALGLAMAVACFSLIGIPLTVGFVGKLLLIKPAFQGGLIWLAVLLVINAAISAAYYLRIVATMFLRPEAAAEVSLPAGLPRRQHAVALGVILSVVGTLALGSVPYLTQELADQAKRKAVLELPDAPSPAPPREAARLP